VGAADTRDDVPDNDLLEGFGRAMAVNNGYPPHRSTDLYVTTGTTGTTSDYPLGTLGTVVVDESPARCGHG